MTLALIVSLAACASGKDADVSNPSSDIQEPEQNDELSTEAQEPGQSGEPSAEEQDGAETKALVVYF